MNNERLRITLDVDIDNNNWYALQLTDVRYVLQIGDASVANGQLAGPIEIAAAGAQSLRLRIDVYLAALINSVLPALSLGELPYRLTISANAGAYWVVRPISHSESSVLRLVPPYGLGRWFERFGLGADRSSG